MPVQHDCALSHAQACKAGGGRAEHPLHAAGAHLGNLPRWGLAQTAGEIDPFSCHVSSEALFTFSMLNHIISLMLKYPLVLGTQSLPGS
jgi:hypothetical protein